MIDDLNLDFEDHDRGRGRRRRAERRDTGAGGRSDARRQDPRQDQWPQQGWAGTASQGWEDPRARGGYDPRARGGYDPRHQPYGAGQHSPYEMSAAGRHARGRGQERQPPHDPRYAQGEGQWQGAPPDHDPRYDTDPRYDNGAGYDPRGGDPRYDTGARAYQQLDDGYDTGSRRGGFIEEGYDEGFLAGAGHYDDDDGGRRSRKAKKKKRRGRSFLALFLTLVLLGALGGGAYFAYDKVAAFFVTPDYDGDGTAETVQIEVKKGQLLGDIATVLVEKDVVKSYKAFVEAAEANKDATNIQPGFYSMHKKMSGKAAVLALLDPKNRNVKGVTIPEGTMTLDIYAKLSKELNIPVANFQAVAKDPIKLGVPDWWFKRGDGKQSARGVEGFLFPDTYQFPANVTAESALKLMIEQFMAVTGSMGFAENVQKNLKISPYEALVAASITQAEAGNDKDMPKIARVLYNRAYDDSWPCKCLQVDVATNYWLRLQGKPGKTSGQLTDADLYNTKNPYRTHVAPGGPPAPGMPIGPIASPGKPALQAAMSPAKGDWTYFVTIDKAGNMAFATSLAQHNANIQLACKNGVPLC